MSHEGMPKPGEFCWNELLTKNPESAKTFYSKLLGWEFVAHDMGGTSPYHVCKTADGKDVGGIYHIPEGQPIPPRWMSYITVENVDAKADEVTKLGGKIVMPATNVSDFGRFIVLEDPTGAHVALWQQLKNCK